MGCSVYSGKRYSNAEVRQMLGQAGWPSALIPLVAAVVMAESGGDPGAMRICGEHSVGLLQVNQDSHPYPTTILTNPVNNLKIAYQIYQSEGPKAWLNSWVRGGWKKYAVGDESPDAVPGSSVIPTNTQTASLFTSIPGVGWLFGDVQDPKTAYQASQGNPAAYRATGQQRYMIAVAIVVLIFAFVWGKF